MGVYEKIKELCEKDGITIAKLERTLGFSNGFVGKTRKSKPSVDKIQKIADYFGVSVEYLTQTEDSPIVHTDGQPPVYYTNEETAKVAQKVFDDPNYRILFDAASDAKPEDILMAAEMLRRFKEARGE